MTRYALIISCEEYSNFKEIAFCNADAGLIQETLVDYCDYEYKTIELSIQYKGCDDTPGEIYRKLQTLIEKSEEGDSVLFYFAGHGVKEGDKGYLLLADSIASDFQNTALDLGKINDLLRNPRINGFLILDACHSGILARNAFNTSVVDIISDTGCVTLASCSENEESYPYPEKEQGVFTYYFCEEIKKIPAGNPVYIEQLKVEVCNRVGEWAKNNYRQQTPTLNGQIVGNTAIAVRNDNIFEDVTGSVIRDSLKNRLEISGPTAEQVIRNNISNLLMNFAQKADSVINDTIEKSTDWISGDEACSLYTSVLRSWLSSNTDLQIRQLMSNNKEWRVFGKYYVYLAYDKSENPWIVMLNVLDKINYSKTLHSFNNLKAIKDYYDRFGKEYKYYQIVVLISQSKVKELEVIMDRHTKLKRVFNNQEIMNTVIYLKEGKFKFVSANYPDVMHR